MYKNILLIPILVLFITESISAQRIKGSDTVLPLTQEWAETFMKEYPGAAVTVTGGGSGVGISAIMEGRTDIAMASRRIKFGEKIKTFPVKMFSGFASLPKTRREMRTGRKGASCLFVCSFWI